MHKITFPEPRRKDSFLFYPSNLHKLTRVSHRTFVQIQTQNVASESRFARKTGLKEMIYSQGLGPELNNFVQIILSLSHSSYCLLHQKNFDISKIAEKKKKEIQCKIWRLLQWIVWKDNFSSNLDALDKARPPFNH